jgi:hypothetical protein
MGHRAVNTIEADVASSDFHGGEKKEKQREKGWG